MSDFIYRFILKLDIIQGELAVSHVGRRRFRYFGKYSLQNSIWWFVVFYSRLMCLVEEMTPPSPSKKSFSDYQEQSEPVVVLWWYGGHSPIKSQQ